MTVSRFQLTRVSGQRLNDAEILADLKSIASRLDAKTVSQPHYRQYGRYDDTTVSRRFGSWNHVKPWSEDGETVFRKSASAMFNLQFGQVVLDNRDAMTLADQPRWHKKASAKAKNNRRAADAAQRVDAADISPAAISLCCHPGSRGSSRAPG
jgi:hypothetical protein